MADKLKGITVKIGADTTELSQALKDINKDINSTSRELKEVEKLLKLDPKNTELLAQKQGLLTKNVEETKKKLQALKDAQDQLESDGVDKNSEQWVALQREISKAQGEVTKFGDELKALNDGKIQAVFDGVATGADEVAKAMGPVSAAAGIAAGGLVAAGLGAVTAADDLNTLSKQTGLSTETLQEAKYAAELIDVSYETFTGSIAKMTAKLRTNEKGFSELGIATRDAKGELLGTEEIFWNSVNALSQMENETERDIAAQELFGKSAADLAGIIDDGGQAFRQLGDDARNSGMIMSQETLNGLNQVNDSIDLLKSKATATLAETGAKAIETLTPILLSLAEALSGVLNWVAQLDSQTVATILTIMGIIAAIAPVASIISTLATTISAVIPIITTLNAVIAANPIVLIIAAIVAAVTAAVILIATHWEEIKGILNGIAEKTSEIKEVVVSKVEDAVNFLKELPKKALEWGRDLIQNFINGIKEKISALKDTISSVANSVKEFLGFSEPEKGPLSNFHTFAPDMMDLYAKGIRDNMYKVQDQVNSLAGSIAGTMRQSANITVNSPIYMDGKFMTSYVNTQLGVLL